jgi:hypothetical protein
MLWEILVETAVAPLNAPYLRCLVVIVQAQNKGPDDYIEARAEASAGDNCCFDLFGPEVDEFAGACSVELEA